MAADKFVKLGTSALEEVEATVTSAGAGNAGDIVALDSSGKLDSSLMPVGIGADTKSIVAYENISAGEIVNVFDDSGTIKVRKADASGGVAKKADGFVLSAATTGNSATVYFEGTITGLSGLTLGAVYYLSATAGGVTTTIPTTATYIAQSIGKAVSATEISFEPGDPVIRA